MKTLSFLLIICTSLSFSQSNESQNGLTDIEFQKAKNEYWIMMQSDIYRANESITQIFIEKMADNDIPEDFADKTLWLLWVEKNLSKTNFNSVNEAREIWEKGQKLLEQQFKEFAELLDYMKRASPGQRHEILKPEFEKNRGQIFRN